MRMRNVILTLVLALSLGLTACEFGQVEQGRCVAFNPETKTLLVVLDVNHDQLNPHYSGGIHEYTLPADPSEIGPLPVPGGRVMFDLEKSTVTIFNPETKALEVLNVNFTDVEKGIKRTHPKVHGKTFPIIDKDKMSVTESSARLQALVTFTIPADKIDLPPATWEAGDEVRMYYKENAKHQALRFMNITRTNIFKK